MDVKTYEVIISALVEKLQMAEWRATSATDQADKLRDELTSATAEIERLHDKLNARNGSAAHDDEKRNEVGI